VCCFGIRTSRAQVERPQPLPETVVLSDTLDIARLVDLASARLGLTIEYDASAVSGTVTVRGAGEMNDEDLWALTNRLLSTKSLTTVRTSSRESLSVVRITEATNVARLEGVFEIAESSRTLPSVRAGFESLTVRARYRPEAELVQAVSPMVGGQAAKLTVAQGSNLILVSGLTPRVDTILDLLERLDMPGETAVVESIEPSHVSAASLQSSAAQLSDKIALVSGRQFEGELLTSADGRSLLLIAPESELAHWRGLIERLDRREAVQTRTYVPLHFGVEDVGRLIEDAIGSESGVTLDDRFRVLADELTGSLIVTATAAQHQQIAELMSRLDESSPESRRSVRRIEVQNRSVDELLSVLSGLIEAGVFGTGGNGLGGAGAGRETDESQMNIRQPRAFSESEVQGTEFELGENTRIDARSRVLTGDRVSLTIDDATNSLIAIGEPRVLDQLAELVQTLDVRQPQVRIEVVMVSLSEGDSLDFAVQLEKLLDLEENTTLRLMSLFGLGLPTGAVGSGGGGSGFTGTVLNPGEFSAVIRALETVNKGRALSRPYLLVGNNQSATFDSVVEEPFVSVNASNTVATTSFGGSQSAGTQISVTPTIAAGDHLELEYSVSLSSFVGESSDPSIPPPRQDSSVSSVSTIPDGYTVVVGGIESITEGEAVSKVPLLGDIPLLGELFKSRGKSRSRSRFFVFIRADVMRGNSFEAIKYASDLATSEAAIDDGWPEVQPRVIR
jgi:general secretion pathway protein D